MRHPNINLYYFEKVETLEKAYWLGWLYAEGSIWQEPNSIRFGVEVGLKDEKLIDEFANAIGFNIKYKDYPKGKNSVIIRLANKIVIENLKRNGLMVGKEKSKQIQLPKLNSRELYLAFILGYFDGDGKEATTQIISGSKEFLRQIKIYFNLKSKITPKYALGKSYIMALGAKLFNEMIDNYHDSLPRKRHRFVSNKQERISRIKTNVWSFDKRKIQITKNELKKLLWKMPLYKIGEKYDVSDKTVRKWCIKWGIKRPLRGYWAQKDNPNKNSYFYIKD